MYRILYLPQRLHTLKHMRTFHAGTYTVIYLLLLCFTFQVSTAVDMGYCKHAHSPRIDAHHTLSPQKVQWLTHCDHCQICNPHSVTNVLFVMNFPILIEKTLFRSVYFYHFISDALHRPPAV
jgi:hypothetical protein